MGGKIIFYERGAYVFHSTRTFMKLVRYYRSPRNGLHNKVDIMRKRGHNKNPYVNTRKLLVNAKLYQSLFADPKNKIYQSLRESFLLDMRTQILNQQH